MEWLRSARTPQTQPMLSYALFCSSNESVASVGVVNGDERAEKDDVVRRES